MKFIHRYKKIILCSLLAGSSYTLWAQQISLVQNGKSNYSIVIPANPNEVEQRAANELKNYIDKSTGATLPIVRENSSQVTYGIYVGITAAAQPLQITKGVKDDGFAIVAKGKNIYINGIKDRGVLYGATEFLERFVGVDYLTATVINVPRLKQITLPTNINIISNPAFITRDNFSDMGFNGKWNGNEKDYSGGYRDWQRINHVFLDWDKESTWGMFGHTFFKLVPPKTYFSSHPEYYSLVDNKRQPLQLNLTNPDVLNIVVKELKQQIQAHPWQVYWMVGQEDMGKFCQCSDCLKAYSKYGGKESGLMIEFINKVAKNFPNKQIATFAYNETEEPPQNIKPDANVIVVSAPIGAHHNAPLNSKENSQWSNYIKQWGTLTNNQMIWDYYADFIDILSPYPNLAVISPNFKFYQSAGIKHVFAQRPVFMPGSEMEALKTYVISKLLWNPALNQDLLVTSFAQKYYGEAGKYVIQYLTALNNNLHKTNAVLLTQQDAIEYSKSFLSPAYILQYNQILDKASAAVKSDIELTNRVNDVRFALDYYVAKVIRNKGGNILSNISQGVKNDFRQRFKSTVQRLNVKFTADASQQSIAPYLNTMSTGSMFKRTTASTAAVLGGTALTYIIRRRRKAKV